MAEFQVGVLGCPRVSYYVRRLTISASQIPPRPEQTWRKAGSGDGLHVQGGTPRVCAMMSLAKKRVWRNRPWYSRKKCIPLCPPMAQH